MALKHVPGKGCATIKALLLQLPRILYEDKKADYAYFLTGTC